VRGVILLYHRVADLAPDPWGLAVHPERFAQQLEALLSFATPVHVDELAAAPPAGGRLPVAITFDDGYRDNLTVALPALERAGWPATLFVAGHGEAEDFWWDVLARFLVEAPAGAPLMLPLPAGGHLRLPRDEPPPAASETRAWRVGGEPSHPRFATYVRCWQALRDLRPADRERALEPVRGARATPAGAGPDGRLSDSDVAQLASSPLVRVGAHTLSHPRLSALGADERRSEIAGSRRRLEQLTGAPVRAFSYPFGGSGDYGRAAVRTVRRAGFGLACRNTPGVVDRGARRFELPRLFVRDEAADAFARRLMALVRTGA
jgi:peptidoglycan/xylan/chitin deacetylase (PgdA/CDA1 family)